MIPVVSRDSAEAFKTRFVSLGELCQKTDMHHKQVRAFRQAGIAPLYFRKQSAHFSTRGGRSSISRPNTRTLGPTIRQRFRN